MDWAEFNCALKKSIRLNKAFAIVDSCPELRGADWGCGWCWVLAESIRRVLGKRASLVMIVNYRGKVQHVLTAHKDLPDMLIDGDGIETWRKKIETSILEGVKGPVLAAFDFSMAKGSAGYDETCVRKLTAFFRRRLGPRRRLS